jgi:hypothetical protein
MCWSRWCLLLLQVIADLKGSESSWSFQTPPSSPSSLGSRKSSMCSISSLNSSSSGSTKSHHSPNHQYWHRSVSQVCHGLLAPYRVLLQMAACWVGRWISTFQRNFHSRNVHLGIIKVLLPGQVPNSVADIHQQGPCNICSHTTRLTTPMYFSWLF